MLVGVKLDCCDVSLWKFSPKQSVWSIDGVPGRGPSPPVPEIWPRTEAVNRQGLLHKTFLFLESKGLRLDQDLKGAQAFPQAS